MKRLKNNSSFFSCRQRAGFTLLEIVICLTIVGVAAALAFPVYVGQVEKAREAEALVHMGAIRRAEILAHQEGGTFLNADNAAEIQDRLYIGVQENFFTYKVVEATDSTFKIIATRLGALMETMGPMTITMGPSGEITNSETFTTPVAGAGGGSSGGGYGGGSSGGGGGGGSSGSGGTSGGGGFGGGSTDGGSSSGGESGGTITFTGGGSGYIGLPAAPAFPTFINRGADTYTSWPDVNLVNTSGTAAERAILNAAFNFMDDSVVTSSIADDLRAKGISISVGAASIFAGGGDCVGSYACFYFAPNDTYTFAPNTPNPVPYIIFNPDYMDEDPQLLSVILAHEGTHFQEYLDGKIQQYRVGQLNVVDIEFLAFWNASVYWDSIRSGFSSSTSALTQDFDYLHSLASQSEAALRTEIDLRY